MQFLTKLDLNRNELTNAVIQVLAEAPSIGVMGQIYYNSKDKFLYQYDGATWKKVGAPTTSLEWSAITDTPTTIEGYRITDAKIENGIVTLGTTTIKPITTINKKAGSEINLTAEDVNALSTSGGSLTGELNMTNHKITNLADASADGDAVNFKQVKERIAQELEKYGNVFDFKGSVPTYNDLPKDKITVGDVWYVEEDSSEYVCIESEGTRKWEKLGVTVDLSGYLKKVDAHRQISEMVKVASGKISADLTTVTVPYSGTLINTYVTDASGEKVITEIDVNSSGVVFTTALKPNKELTCTVVYSNWTGWPEAK